MIVDGSPFRLDFEVAEYLDGALCIHAAYLILLCDERSR